MISSWSRVFNIGRVNLTHTHASRTVQALDTRGSSTGTRYLRTYDSETTLGNSWCG
jgi:hypothetical protein